MVATFTNLPDVPFESIEVNIPTGPYSEFGANLPAKDHYDFCGQKLTVPTYFKASNGTETHQNTTVTITGCPKTTKHHKTRTKKPQTKQKQTHPLNDPAVDSQREISKRAPGVS